MTPLHLCSTLDEVTQGLEVRTATMELEISQLREALKTIIRKNFGSKPSTPRHNIWCGGAIGRARWDGDGSGWTKRCRFSQSP